MCQSKFNFFLKSSQTDKKMEHLCLDALSTLTIQNGAGRQG